MAPSAVDRLREAFRPPESFGAADDAECGTAYAASTTGTTETVGNDRDTGINTPSHAGIGRVGRFRVDPGLPGFWVLALTGSLAVILAGVYLWSSRPKPHPASQPILQPAAQPATAPPSAATRSKAAPSTPDPSPSTLVVDVAGKVRHPGVVTLTPGARVIDAIKEAGGLHPGVNTGSLNLARRVVDGEQIPVGMKTGPDPAAPPEPPSVAPGTAAPGAPLDLNTATAAQFDQLPGVGPVLAQRIVDYRTQHSGFHSVDELRHVSGIGDAKFADLKALVRV